MGANKTKILAFGTFDILHKGHLHFFRQARKLAKKPFLIVSVARDANVKKIKGKKPLLNERLRLLALKKIKIINKVVLGVSKNYLNHILKIKPDIIALGYDQKAYTFKLKEKLVKRGLRVKIVRLKPYQPKLYKSSIIKKML